MKQHYKALMIATAQLNSCSAALSRYYSDDAMNEKVRLMAEIGGLNREIIRLERIERNAKNL